LPARLARQLKALRERLESTTDEEETGDLRSAAS